MFRTTGIYEFCADCLPLQSVVPISAPAIPLLYAISNPVSCIGALAFGWIYDRVGLSFLAAVTAAADFFAPLVFWGDPSMAICRMILWGIGQGSRESILRAVVAFSLIAQLIAVAVFIRLMGQIKRS